MKRRVFCLLFALTLCAGTLTGCQERQLYPLENLSPDGMNLILLLFGNGETDEGYSEEYAVEGYEIHDIVEILQGLRMTSEVDWASISSPYRLVLIDRSEKVVEIEGNAEAVRVGDRYYLWPWKSYQAFNELTQELHSRSAVNRITDTAAMLWDMAGYGLGFDETTRES